MEIDCNLPNVSVRFTHETPWQRQVILSTLRAMGDEASFVKPSEQGNLLDTTVAPDLREDQVVARLLGATLIPKPKAPTRPVERVKTHADYL